MRKILIATHATFADGIKKTLEFIAGEQEHVSALCAYMSEEFDMEREVKQAIANLHDDDELIVLVDLFGGSVSNAFASEIRDPRVHVIAGVNFPLLVDLVLSADGDIETIIVNAIENGKRGIQYVNKVLLDQMNEEDEFDD